MRKLTGFIIALLLGIAGAVVFDGRTARAGHSDEHVALPFNADPVAMYIRAYRALSGGNRAVYEEYKGRLKTMANYGSTDPGTWGRGSTGKAGAARRLLNDLPAFDRAPDLSHDAGDGDGK